VQPAAKAEPFALPRRRVDDVIALLVGSCWHHLLKNHAVVLEGSDAEGVHQMRVALRRLRPSVRYSGAIFRRLHSRRVNSEAQWLMQQLGRRGMGCFRRDNIRSLVTAAPDVDLVGLREAVEQQRKSSYGALQTVLAACPLPAVSCSRWGTWWNAAVGATNRQRSAGCPVATDSTLPIEFWRDCIARRSSVAAHFRQLNTDAQHDLRIGLKKLRYAAEFLLRFTPPMHP